MEMSECSSLLYPEKYLLKAELKLLLLLVVWNFIRNLPLPYTDLLGESLNNEKIKNAHNIQVIDKYFLNSLIRGKLSMWVSQDYISVFWSTCHLMNTCSGPIRHKVMVELHCLIPAANEGVDGPVISYLENWLSSKKREWKAAYRMQ